MYWFFWLIIISSDVNRFDILVNLCNLIVKGISTEILLLQMEVSDINSHLFAKGIPKEEVIGIPDPLEKNRFPDKSTWPSINILLYEIAISWFFILKLSTIISDTSIESFKEIVLLDISIFFPDPIEK